MLGELSRDSRHVGWAPGEDAPFFVEEFYEGTRLFFGKVCIDPHCLVWVCWVHLMGYRVAIDAKVLGDLLDYASTGEWENAFVYHHGYFFGFLLCSKGVGDLVEVAVAFVLSEEAFIDRDDSYGSWHLELEVCVVWDGHELGESWSTKYSVVLRLPIYHFEYKGFSSKVVSAPEDDVEVDPSQR